jgi:hypothetical protein
VTSGAASIAALRRISLHLSNTGHADGQWFAAALQEFEAGARLGLTLDAALDLRPGTGQTSWWEAEAIVRRDELIRTIAGRHFPGMSRRRAADAIVREAQRYQTTAWRSQRAYRSAPAELVGTLRGDLFALLKIGTSLSIGTARRALAHESLSFGEPGARGTMTPELREASNASNDEIKAPT